MDFAIVVDGVFEIFGELGEKTGFDEGVGSGIDTGFTLGGRLEQRNKGDERTHT